MPVRHLFFCLSLLLPALLCAQPDLRIQGPHTNLYRLTHAEARYLLRKKPVFDERWCHTLADTFHGLKPTRPLPPGHYLAVSAREEMLHAELLTVGTLQVRLLPNDRDLQLLVLDSLGQPETGARLTLNGKRVPYNPRLQCYYLPKRARGGFLEVYAEGEAQFFQLENEIDLPLWRRRWRHALSAGVGSRIMQPWRQLCRRVELRKTGGAAFMREQARLRRFEKRRFEGYMAFSQPVYRPLDTLRLKAYVTRRDGRPYGGPLLLEVFEGYRADSRVLQQRVAPASPGVYLYDWPLSDTLTLDQQYRVILRHPGKNVYRRVAGTFSLEDYELDEARYTLEPLRPDFPAGEPFVLRLGARDANDQPIPDAFVALTVRVDDVPRYRADGACVPDTLWQHRQAIGPDGSADIVVPDSLFPAADLGLRIVADFRNGAGELQQRQAFCRRTTRDERLEIAVRGGQVLVQRAPARMGPDSALLRYTWSDGRVTARRIALPWREPLAAAVTKYAVSADTLKTALAPANERGLDSVRLLLLRQGDSVFAYLRNPHGLEVRYTVLREDRVAADGMTSARQLDRPIWVGHDPEGRHFTCRLGFLWGGEAQEREDDLPYYKNLLHLEVQQPAAVQPGASAQVRLRVLDHRGRPVPNADLTAGAYNAQFDAGPPYDNPDIRYRRPREAFVYNDFHLSACADMTLRSTTPLTAAWYERLGLDSVLYYRLRYRLRGAYAEARPVLLDTLPGKKPFFRELPRPDDTFYRTLPQFAPYLIRANQAQPVYLIYCNKKLVYYHGSSDRPPYSFFGRPGYNQIAVRTRDAEYVVDSVWLTPGQKLELAIDGDRYAEARAPLRIQALRRPDTLTDIEQMTLRRSMFLWRPGSSDRSALRYFWQSNETVHLLYPFERREYHVLGPFDARLEIRYFYPDQFYRRIEFEPGYTYEVTRERERLYSTRWPRSLGKFPFAVPDQHPGRQAWGAHHIQPLTSALPPIHFKHAGRPRSGAARLIWAFNRSDTLLMGIVLRGADTLLGPYEPSARRLEGLPPGTYDLLLYTRQDYRIIRSVQLRAHARCFVDLTQGAFQPAPPGEHFHQLFYPDLPDSIFHSTPRQSHFSQWPGSRELTLLQGQVTDENGEALIGAAVKIMQDGIFVRGVLADYDGNYSVRLPAGLYDVEVSYTGYVTQRIMNIQTRPTEINRLDLVLDGGEALQEVVITAYKIPLIEQDKTASGMTLTSAQIRGLPTRSVQFIEALAGDELLSKDADVGSISIKGDDEAPPLLDEFMPAGAGLRSNFRDYAYWQPRLRTDANGEAAFQAHFPDNITRWDSYAVGVDRRARAGVARGSVQAYKMLTAQLALPRFALPGDFFLANGRVTNRTGDTLPVRTAFYQEDRLLQQREHRAGAGLVEYAGVTVPGGADSLRLRYELSGALAADGEARSLPIGRIGALESTGAFLLLEGDTALTLGDFPPERGPVLLQARTGALELMLDDARYLREYPYACNEQTASRLTGLLAEKTIQARLGRPFEHERALRAALERLQNAQRPDGSWGWWPGAASNAWMSLYVLDALGRAREAGYASDAWESGLLWLRHHFETLRLEDKRAGLTLLRQAGVNVDCRPVLAALDSVPARNVYDKLVRLRLHQLCGDTLRRDSLERLLRPTALGGLYCGEERPHWYDRRAVNTLLAYDIARAAGWSDLGQGIRRYWLESRPAAARRNTIETAQTLAALLSDWLPDAGAPLQPVQVEINGAAQSLNGPAAPLTPAPAISIRKTGQAPAYLAVYQQWHNPAPAPRDDLFAVRTHFEQGGQAVDSLRRGEAAVLVVTVQAQRAADYVLIEAPIPAGCSYETKLQSGWPETHREYFRDRVAIFCESLPTGAHVFRVLLEPRFAGAFTLNPARAELMYFPVLFGRNGVGGVRIGTEK